MEQCFTVYLARGTSRRRMFPGGAQRDIDDPIVRAGPEISLDLAGKPVKKPDEAAWVGGLAGTR
jgi:hypothetical protein